MLRTSQRDNTITTPKWGDFNPSHLQGYLPSKIVEMLGTSSMFKMPMFSAFAADISNGSESELNIMYRT